MGKDRPTSSLAPGFRFHPTDEELVSYYLRRKIYGKPFRFDAISEIDIYKAEPWDLPAFSKLKSRDLEWYFFSALDKKYENGSKTNRATTEGYWKTTGKDRPVYHKSQVAGMKKTLVFHRGRAPRGERTNWVMHEYRVIDKELDKVGVARESFVLCRIFLKSGPGPKNGEKYGAPYVEEDWEDYKEEVIEVPGPFIADTVVSDEASFDMIDIVQNLEAERPLPVSYDDTGCNYAGDPTALTENDTNSFSGVNETQFSLGMTDDQNFFSLPVQAEIEKVKNEYIPQRSHVVSHGSSSYLPAEHSERNANSGSNESSFLEGNDLSEPLEPYSSEFELHEQYLTYFDAENIDQYISFDASEDLLDNDVSLSDGPFVAEENLKMSAKQECTSDQLPQVESSDIASSSKQTPKPEPDFEYPIFKQAGHMLGKFPGSTSFASELREKDMVARLNAASAQSSEPIRVSAGMIRIRDYYSADDNRMRWSLDKNGNLSVFLSFDIPGAISDILPGKMASSMSRDWFYSLLFWVILLAISARIGVSIHAKMIL